MRRLAPLFVLFGLIGGCATQHNVHVAPLEVQPIRVTMDVNVNVHESAESVGDEADEAGEAGDVDADETDDARRPARRAARRGADGPRGG